MVRAGRAPIFVVAFLLYLVFPTCLLVTDDAVKLRMPPGITLRKVSIAGLADLYMDGETLYRATGGRRIVQLSRWRVRRSDIEVLRSRTNAARSAR